MSTHARRSPRVTLVMLMASVLAIACKVEHNARSGDAQVASVPQAELLLAPDAALLLDSADALLTRHPTAALVSVDSAGRPRVRSVGAFRLARPETPRDRFTVFVLTRRSTRKLEQLESNPAVTLYFDEDDRTSYASIMGRATIHRDPRHPRLQEFLDSATIRFFWPDFPRDFVMLEITPAWIEFMGPGLWNDPQNWRPHAVVFE